MVLVMTMRDGWEFDSPLSHKSQLNMRTKIFHAWGTILIAASVVGAFCIAELDCSLWATLFLALLDLFVGLIGCGFANIKSK